MTYSLARCSFIGGITLLMDTWQAVSERAARLSTANNRMYIVTITHSNYSLE